jgi:subtilase family serine protease
LKTSKSGFVVLFLALELIPSAMAQTSTEAIAPHPGIPYPNARTPKAVDMGALKEQGEESPMSVTIVLSLPELNKAEDLLNSLHTPGNPQYHQFLTAEEFAARFAPKNAAVAKVIASLAKYGLTAETDQCDDPKGDGTAGDHGTRVCSEPA